jgi:hypothetical protein
MEIGILEKVLTRRYGQPITSIRHGMDARLWNTHNPDDEAVLYLGMKWTGLLQTRFSSLRGIYGDSCGGYLIKNALKAAILLPRKVYGVWNIDDLQMQPEVQQAVVMDPAIDYFMEASNVWFYGVKAGQLYVFDSETDELDRLGPVEPALETLMDEHGPAE